MKNKIKPFVSAIALIACMSSFANNIESWNTLQISTKIDRFTIGASEELRIGTDQNETTKKIDEFHTTVFADYSVSDWLSLGIQNDMVLLRNGSDRRYRRDNRPGLNLTLKHSFCGFNLSNRSRFVLRDLQGEQPYLRYRNLTKIFTPVVYDGEYLKNVKLFAGYEWYFDRGSRDRDIRKNDRFGQMWFDFGLRFNVSERYALDLFYRLVELKSTSGHDWSPGHVIGVNISVSF